MNLAIISEADAKQLREYLSKQSKSICALAGTLADQSLKAQCLAHQKEVEDYLASFAGNATDDALSADFTIKSLSSLVTSLSGLVLSLGAGLGANPAAEPALAGAIEVEVKAGKLIPADALPGKIAEAVAAKVTAGELVEKAAHGQLCAEHRAAGVKEGEQRVRDEIAERERVTQLVAKRKEALQTAGLPLPPADLEAVLGTASDEEFATQQKQVVARLSSIGVQLATAEAQANAWRPDKDWNVFAAMAKTLVPSQTANPFAQRHDGAPPIESVFPV